MADGPNEEDGGVAPSPLFYKIVLTGGPCAGKTTALDRLSAYLRERGFRVFTVPEAATMLFSNGVFFSDLGKEGFPFEFQKAVLSTQVGLEDTFMKLAEETGETSVLICDRGACDGKAYITTETWQQLLRSRQLDSEVQLREARYNAVFHLVTAAAGAEKFYTLANNTARRETAEEARGLDEKTQQAWMGHPQHFVFDNLPGRNSFEAKMQRVVDTMAKIVGLPLVQRKPTKFLLFDPPVTAEYLVDPNAPPPPQPSSEASSGGVPTPPKTARQRDLLAESLRAALGCGRNGLNAGGLDPLMVFEVEKIYVLGVGGGVNAPRSRPGSATPSRAHSPLPHSGSNGNLGSLGGGGDSTPELLYSFIRRRSQAGFSVYGHTMVRKFANGERTETKRIINKREYDWLKESYADPSRHIVVQRRYCFLHRGKSYSLYKYLEPRSDLSILHSQAVQLPPSLPEEDTAAAGQEGGEASPGGQSSEGGGGSSEDPGGAAAVGGSNDDFPPFLRVGGPLDEDGALSAYRLSLKGAQKDSSIDGGIDITERFLNQQNWGAGGSGGLATPPNLKNTMPPRANSIN